MRRTTYAALPLALIGLCAAQSQAQVPDPILDRRKYVQAEIYDLAPARRAEWEQGRYSMNGIWIGLGGYHFRDLDAVERGVINLPFTSWFMFHGDLRNDRDRDAQVRRLVVDLWGRLLPWLWLGPSGAPAIPASQKENYAIGASALIADSDRQRFLLARLVLDALFYNRLNTVGGHRPSPTFHPEIEARWAAGEWSVYSRLDLTSLTETFFPQTQLRSYQATSRAEYEFHFRYARPKWEGDARFDLLGLRDDRDENGQRVTYRRLLTTSRVEGLVRPLTAPVAFRFGVRLLTESVHGRGGDTYQLFRLEPGFRAIAIWEAGTNQLELGYASGLPHFAFTLNGSDLDQGQYEDSAYAQWEYSPAKRFHLRAQLTWRVAGWGFGGGSVLFLAQF